MKKNYIYVLSSHDFSKKVGSKIGVSFFPERRTTQLKKYGYFSVFSKYEIATREEALRLEKIIIDEFRSVIASQGKREFFSIEPKIIDERLCQLLSGGN
ncbi:MAG: GIY-YIG nuclease family protein [Rickettsiales bacterium]|nr:GIY-YIG nuclease family protein [Rickettsiales bacterium]